ncbi:hypothetical protein [Hyphomonas sp.]|uniref:hypothetical protein n=1 Tax=Hyphomonas sp. TaxID=87 RepID=UPI000C8CCBAA|nr:hypothetical protein [Hyphomonas sp.]MAL46992.1 hypothetical protein [Hyphomonas sp.]
MAQNLVLNILAKDKTKQALAGVRAGLARLRTSIFSVQSAIVGIGAGVAVRSFINVGREVEQLRLRFFFLFGSVNEGRKAFDTLVKFAGRVPFSLQEIAQASGNLAVVSKDAEELGTNLELVGNIAAVTGIDFRIAAEQVQRSLSAGLASAEIFRERGVRAMLGFKSGVTLNAEQSAEALLKVFGPGGKFGKAAEVLGTTFDGTLSMIGDKIFQFKLETNEAGFFDFVKGGLITINKLVDENQKVLRKFAQNLSKGLITFIEEAIVGLVSVVNALKVVFKTIGSGIAGIIDIINFLPPVVREMGIIGFLMLGTKGRVVVFTIGLIFNQIGALLKKLGIEIDLGFMKSLESANGEVKGIRDVFERVREEIEKNTIEVTEMQKEVEKANEAAKALERNISPFRKELEKLNEDSLKKLTKLSDQAFQVINMGIQGMSKGIAETIVLGKDLGTSFKVLGEQILIKIISALVEIVAKIGLQILLEQTAIAELLVKLGIEKQITAEKEKQNKAQKDKNKQAFISMLLGVPAFASGGALMAGRPAIVGERGPELFVPNSTGQITQSARGLGGRAVNVNFNINTIDSRGFDEALVENRGTITSIINNALAEKGRGGMI